MCSLLINAASEAAIVGMGTRDKEKFERQIANHAAEDSIELANGLWQLLNPVDDWAMHPELKAVRKLRKGRHRFYIKGRHTDCKYLIVFILVNKRDEDDRSSEKSYQNKVLNALSTEVIRQIESTPPSGDI